MIFISNTLVVNLFGGAGCGKSTIAANVFAELKWKEINCELVTEFAKDLVWEERFNTMQNQVYILGKQLNRIERLIDKVDVIITDSPLILSVIYKPDWLSESFDSLVLEIFNKYNNLNYYLIRKKKYNPKGRIQNLEEAQQIDDLIYQKLLNYHIKFQNLNGEKESVEHIVNDILRSV